MTSKMQTFWFIYLHPISSIRSISSMTPAGSNMGGLDQRL